MIKNRSVPTDTVLAHVFCASVEESLGWYARTFGFTEYYRFGPPGGPASGAQMRLDNAYIMLKSGKAQGSGPRTHYLTVIVDNVDTHYERARLAGAKITEELNETCYGERQYGVQDLEGNFWLFSKHVQDLDPSDWGAAVAYPGIPR
ncbi:MAG: VOC family protein [Bryobacteraceae bacterium]